ncbi:FHA domain-containing protein [Kitasatospora sp. LaBMicrA B282]|uniref:FHA domain-containing protein n=1 Tax=Kitasatospora sp. LaBMicrA B282 TaxID=3420949 RepID=UPI003D141CFD
MSAREHRTALAPVDPAARAARPSEADRERALDVLRAGAGDGRLSHDTFVRRMEQVLLARTAAELDAALVGLPSDGRLARFALRAVGRLSAFTVRLRDAWQTEQLPGLTLPPPGRAPLRIGRAPGSDLRLADDSVSRRHAELRPAASGWVLYDLGSTNGTHVNGHRVTGGVRVRPGDRVAFGNQAFRLATG